VVVALGIAGYIVVRDLRRDYRTADGARVERFTLHSRYVHADLHEIRIVPKEHGDWTLVFMHGHTSSPEKMLSQSLFDSLEALGTRAPIVLLPDGGGGSYWHNRASGDWGTMVLSEIVPRHGRVAIGGISMGGYGALMLGAYRHFCAIGAHSPALWMRAGDSAPGAFDDAEDYARHDIVHNPPHYTAPVWIDVATGDPFRDTAVYYAHEVHAQLHVWPGGHNKDYWWSHMREYLAFYAGHCA
jgi:hypothetical protein